MSDIALNYARGHLKGHLTRTQKYLESVTKENRDIFQLKSRREVLVGKLKEFEELQAKIEILDQTSNHEEEREKFEDIYFSIIAKLDLLLADSPNPAPSPSPSPSTDPSRGLSQFSETTMVAQQIRLPRIDLPQFKGCYEDWCSFYDTFNSLIHNNTSLSEIQKFHYLKSSLKDDAAAVINSLEILAINYDAAWTMLRERYDNKRLIVHNHLKSLTDLPSILKENHILLRQLLDNVLKHTRALKALKRPVDQWDDWLVHIVATKLDINTNKEWEKTFNASELPTFDKLTQFLSHRCQILEAIAQRPATAAAPKPSKPSHRQGFSANAATNSPSCQICKGAHYIHKCDKFNKMPARQRIKEVKAKNMCTNCLRSTSHNASSCTSGKCRKCNQQHNTLLHIPEESRNDTSESAENSATKEVESPIATINCMTRQHAGVGTVFEVLMPTAIVNAYDVHGKPTTARVFLDSGPQLSFISEALVSRLHLKRKNFKASFNGIGNKLSCSNHIVSVKIGSRHNAFTKTIDCFVLKQIMPNLPLRSLKQDDFYIPRNLKLADPSFHASGPIDILISNEHFYELHCVGQIRANKKHPWLQKTLLGWVVSGLNSGINALPLRHASCNLALSNLNSLLAKMWELDDCGDNVFTPEGRECESHLKKTYKRNDDGRFVVQIPIRDEKLELLGESKSIALKRFFNLERKLNKHPALKKDYTNFINEYIELRHMKIVNERTPVDGSYYLPHHAVVKETSLTTKLRVVFDASCKTSSGVSLNDVLKIGPVVQQDLFSIITRFRTFKFVLTGDIAKMYRQILVDSSQTHLQRILWRDKDDKPIEVYELLTVTYGTAPASYLATRSLNEIAELKRDQCPKGASVILRDFYVDDLLTGANSLSDLCEIREQVVEVLRAAGLEFRKWASNNPEILQSIPNHSEQGVFLNKDEDVRALGLQWNPTHDVFQYPISFPVTSQRVTKRSILSCIAHLFDPLGLIAPIIITAKILMQQLWRERLDWDESVPAAVHTKWMAYQF